MYDAVEDPYCYPQTTVLKNRAGLHTRRALTRFEMAMAAQRADEPLPAGRLSVRHYCAIHHHLFQDVYAWAGQFRSMRISKAGSMFCYPEHIPREMRNLFGISSTTSICASLTATSLSAARCIFLQL